MSVLFNYLARWFTRTSTTCAASRELLSRLARLRPHCLISPSPLVVSAFNTGRPCAGHPALRSTRTARHETRTPGSSPLAGKGWQGRRVNQHRRAVVHIVVSLLLSGAEAPPPVHRAVELGVGYPPSRSIGVGHFPASNAHHTGVMEVTMDFGRHHYDGGVSSLRWLENASAQAPARRRRSLS